MSSSFRPARTIRIPSTSRARPRPRDIIDRFGPTPSNTDAPHPSTDFRLSFASTATLTLHRNGLCRFTLHFDRSHLRLYDEPPQIAAPRPPGVMVDLGSIDVVADEDDPGLLSLLEEQIRHECTEALDRRTRTGTRSTTRLQQVFAQARCSDLAPLLGALVFLLAAISILVIWIWAPEKPLGPPHSPTVLVPLIPQVSNMTVQIANLGPTIFFNQFFYTTIGDVPDLIPGKLATLFKSLNITQDLISNVSRRIFNEEFHPYLTPEQQQATGQRWVEERLEFAGLTRTEAHTIRRDMATLVRQAEIFLRDMKRGALSWWLDSIALSIGQVVGNIAQPIDWSPDNNLFMANSSRTDRWIPKASLPAELPRGIRQLLDVYRIFLSDNRFKFLDGSCLALHDCKSSPSAPSCFPHDTAEAAMEHLAAWAISARGIDVGQEYSSLAQHVRAMAQIKDMMEQAIQAGEMMNHAETRLPAPAAAGIRDWFTRSLHVVYGEQEAPTVQAKGGYVGALREILKGPFWRQFHDTIQGMFLMGSICGKLESFSELVDSLYTPKGWIIDEDDTHVQLWKLPSVRDQQFALNATYEDAFTMVARLQRYEWLWEQWEALKEGDDEGWRALWLDNAG
ncbi:hypothetical protein F66182_7564 [Fusarium sp. NRRL 66182]|nr:hypothetical protein F66182_7564 [Fusarium sp. NRRL 66182]